MEHQYSLKWNNHPQNISAVFAKLRNEELFVDVTLATSDRQIIRAHRVVLSAGSVYLEKILAITPSEHPTLVLSNLKYKELKLLVDFMYSGEISVDQPLLGSLLEAANWLQVKGLYENGLEQETELEPERPETEPSIGSCDPKSPITLDLDQYRRKRNHSEESEVRCESPESALESSSPPTKVPKTVFGLTNTGWLMDPIKEKNSEEVKINDIQDIPNLLNLANHQNFLQHLKTESPSKPVIEPSLNEHMLQAMQLCGTSYLSQLAALQNCSQNKPLSSFTGSFTSYATSNAISPGFKGGILNSAPVRRYKQYSEDTLQAALKEIMEGQSINRSSMKYNIPARTLRDWMKRLNIKSVYTHHAKDKDGSVGSTSPEPEINLTLSEKFRNVAFPGLSANSQGDIDDEDTETLKIDEGCQNFNSVAEMAA